VSLLVDPLETVELEDMSSAFKINALGPLALFQASRDLLKKSSYPKWVSVSRAAGSISAMEAFWRPHRARLLRLQGCIKLDNPVTFMDSMNRK